jgi:hypothetical protein
MNAKMEDKGKVQRKSLKENHKEIMINTQSKYKEVRNN